MIVHFGFIQIIELFVFGQVFERFWHLVLIMQWQSASCRARLVHWPEVNTLHYFSVVWMMI